MGIGSNLSVSRLRRRLAAAVAIDRRIRFRSYCRGVPGPAMDHETYFENSRIYCQFNMVHRPLSYGNFDRACLAPGGVARHAAFWLDSRLLGYRVGWSG